MQLESRNSDKRFKSIVEAVRTGTELSDFCNNSYEGTEPPVEDVDNKDQIRNSVVSDVEEDTKTVLTPFGIGIGSRVDYINNIFRTNLNNYDLYVII